MTPRNPPARATTVPLDDLVAAPRNPRVHAKARIAASLDRFGFMRPVSVQADGRTVIAGHGTVEALRERRAAGLPPPEGCEGWRVPVYVSHLSGARAAGALVAENEAQGRWEPEGLLELLAELAEADALAGTGFALEDVERMAAAAVERDREAEERTEEVDERERQRTIVLVFDAGEYLEAVRLFAAASVVLGVSGYRDIVLKLLRSV